MNPDSFTVLLLTNQLVKIGTKPLSSRELRSLRRLVPEIRLVMEASSRELVVDYGIDPELAGRVESLCAAATAFAFEVEKLEESGIRILSDLDTAYPQRLLRALGPKSAAFLLVAGNLDLLEQPARGIVGSRNVDPKTLAVASDAAVAAAARGDAVVSGLAKGVDQAAMLAALEAGGTAIGIPSEGLRRAARSIEVRSRVHDGNMCLLSPYGPDVTFSVGRAMGRNRLVYGIAESTLVVASDLGKGGTWAGATEAMKEDFGVVDAWMGDGSTAGNAKLVALGARPVKTRDDFWDSNFVPPPTATSTSEMQPRLF